MSDAEGLGAIFLAHLRGGLGDRPTPEHLDASLARVWEEARTAWPGISLDAPRFIRHLAERIQPHADLTRALTEVCTADLYLACACAHDLPGALRRFDEHYAETISRTARKIDRRTWVVDEVIQEVRRKLFVPEADKTAKIVGYAAHGPLGKWIAVVTGRVALDMQLDIKKETRRERAETEEAKALPPPSSNPEREVSRRRDAERLQAAFEASIGGLTQRQRFLVHMHFVRGTSHDKIARMSGRHQTTVTREIRRAREALRRGIQAYCRKHFNMTPSELGALSPPDGNQLHLSLSRLLKAEDEGPLDQGDEIEDEPGGDETEDEDGGDEDP